MDLEFIANQVIPSKNEQSLDTQLSSMIDADGIARVEPAATAGTISATKISLADYRKKQKEIIENQPDDCSDSSLSESEDDEEWMVLRQGKIHDVFDMENIHAQSGPPKTKHEMEILPPVDPLPFFRVPDYHQLIQVGHVHNIIDSTITVKSDFVSDQNLPLDHDSLLFYGDRTAIGKIFDTFGPIQEPFYTIRFNSSDDIDNERAVIGAAVYRSPEYSTIVLTNSLKKMKGTDASNIFDEELPEEEQEYSDDEAERSAKKQKARDKKRKLDMPQLALQAETIAKSLPFFQNQMNFNTWNPSYNPQ